MQWRNENFMCDKGCVLICIWFCIRFTFMFCPFFNDVICGLYCVEGVLVCYGEFALIEFRPG